MLQVLGFASRHAAEEYMIANPETTLGAVHFNVDSSGINYIIQTNTTVRRLRSCCTNIFCRSLSLRSLKKARVLVSKHTCRLCWQPAPCTTVLHPGAGALLLLAANA
jgi:hypothetical protein